MLTHFSKGMISRTWISKYREHDIAHDGLYSTSVKFPEQSHQSGNTTCINWDILVTA